MLYSLENTYYHVLTEKYNIVYSSDSYTYKTIVEQEAGGIPYVWEHGRIIDFLFCIRLQTKLEVSERQR